MSRWAVAPGRCCSGVKQLALKGTRATRCGPSRCEAWLRGDTVSPNEASFDLRENYPLSRNILHSRDLATRADTGQRTNPRRERSYGGYRGWSSPCTSPKVSTGYLIYPVDVRDTAKSGMGHGGNRHLHHLAESISVNVGGSPQDAKESSLPMPAESVGAVIVVGARENRVQGEGPQSVGSPT
jgi:hypothetical protein